MLVLVFVCIITLMENIILLVWHKVQFYLYMGLYSYNAVSLSISNNVLYAKIVVDLCTCLTSVKRRSLLCVLIGASEFTFLCHSRFLHLIKVTCTDSSKCWTWVYRLNLFYRYSDHRRNVDVPKILGTNVGKKKST